MIGGIRDEIRKYNPDFKGFIIQTTANVAAGDGRKDDGNIEAFHELGVKYTEIGVESVNPETFQAMRKSGRSLKRLIKIEPAPVLLLKLITEALDRTLNDR